MAAIIEVPGDKRRFLAGMHWATHESRPSRKKMLEIAADEGYWVAQRRGQSIIQSGYCHPLDGIRNPKGLLSIAGMIAEAKPEPWLGIFDLGNQLYWYVAVRDNNGILPDGDVVGTYDEVSTARAQSAGLGSWTYVDGGLSELATMLHGSGRPAAPVSIRDIRRRPWVGPVVASAVIGGATIGGLWAWHAHEAQEAHDRAVAMARERAMIAAMQAKKTAQAVLPWTREPSPSAFLATCGRLLGALPVSEDGWLLSSVDCRAVGSDAVAQAHWLLGPGATTARMPSGVLSQDGNQVDGEPMTARLTEDRDGRAEDAQKALRALYAVAQPLGISVSVTAARHSPVAALPGGKAVPVENPERKPWQTMEIFMKTSLPVLSLGGLGARLDAIPGFRLSNVSAKGSGPAAAKGAASANAGGPWEMAGKLYVSRVPTPSAGPVERPSLPGGTR
jgi:hypothetical protein